VPQTPGGSEEDELRHHKVRVFEAALGGAADGQTNRTARMVALAPGALTVTAVTMLVAHGRLDIPAG
jgi:hypothetical protein